MRISDRELIAVWDEFSDDEILRLWRKDMSRFTDRRGTVWSGPAIVALRKRSRKDA